MSFVVIGKTNLGINPGRCCHRKSTPFTLWPHSSQLTHPRTSHSPYMQNYDYIFPSSPRLCLCCSLYLECPSLAGPPSEFPFMPQIPRQASPHLLQEAFPKWPSHLLTVSPDLMPSGSHTELMAHFSALADPRFPNWSRHQTHLDRGNLQLQKSPS